MSKVVILNRADPRRIRYDEVIDHTLHDVTYVGHFLDTVSSKATEIIPAKLSELSAKDLPQVIEAACADCDVLIARGERDLVLAAQIRERFNITGDTLAKVLPIRDKLTMRMAARHADIRQPDYWSLSQYKRKNTSMPVDRMLVLKPRLDAASNGIWIGKRGEIDVRVDALDEHDWLIEEFVAGDIFHLDGYLLNGNIGLLQSSRYVSTCFSFASGSPLGSTQLDNPEWATSVVTDIAKALDYRDGGFHLEMIVDAAGVPYFLEFAGRIGGAYIAEAFEHKTGVNLHHADLRCILGDAGRISPGQARQDMFGWLLFPYGADIDCSTVKQTFRDRLVQCHINARPSKPDVPSYSEFHSPFGGIIRSTESCEAEINAIVRHVTAPIMLAKTS